MFVQGNFERNFDMSFFKRLHRSVWPCRGRRQVWTDFAASFAPTDPTQSIRSLCYSGLRYRITENTEAQRVKYDNYEASLPIYIHMINIAYHLGCRSILELGAGLSTGLFANYARVTGARVQTIEVDFDPMWSYVGGTNLESLVTDYIELHQGATITSDKLNSFYQTPKTSLGNVPVTKFAHILERFTCPHPRCKQINNLENWNGKSIENLIVEEKGKLLFPMPLLNMYSSGRYFDNEVAFLDKIASKGSSGLLHNFLTEGQTWDFIFFDSGELSSIVEWEELKNHIQIGGIAAFHDIFFPKSIKNFVVCASLMGDPNWKPIFIDQTTAQGGFVVQRIH